MSVLPRSIPAKYTEQLRTALEAAHVDFDPTLKAGSRITYTVTHNGRTWELRYLVPGYWKLTGQVPAYSWGPGVSLEEAVTVITAPDPEAEAQGIEAYGQAELFDPCPGAPRTHIGVPVPEVIRQAWNSPLADGWRFGVTSALAAR